MDNTTQICFYSYNTRGSNENKLNYIQDLMKLCGNKVPIFCIQEHFLLRSNLRKLSNYFEQSAVLAIPATNDFNIQNRGRPNGGLAIILPKMLRKSVKILNVNSWRIQPVVIEIQGEKLLLINCYFPTDKTSVNEICPELDECLANWKGFQQKI